MPHRFIIRSATYIGCWLLLAARVFALVYTPVQHHLKVDASIPAWLPGELIIKPKDDFHLVGADIMDEISFGWVKLYRQAYPRLDVTIEARASSSGIPALISGQADLAPVGREILPAEDKAFVDKFGYHPLEIRVATGAPTVLHKTAALVILVSKENPIEGLTLAQLDAICSKTRRRGHADIRTWGDAGLGGEWAARPISLYGLESNGIEKFVKNIALQGGEWKDGVHYVTNEGFTSFATVAANHIAKDIGGLTYGALANLTPAVKVVPLAENEGEPFVMPTVENIYTHRYPLSRYAYIYLNRPPGRPIEPKRKEFLKLVLSREGQDVVAREGIYIPLLPQVVREELAKLE